MATKEQLKTALREAFPFEPTAGQSSFLQAFPDFLASTAGNDMFILTGYAGTGKTSLVISLVKTLPDFRWKVVLLAPTGRAAKVMSGYTGKTAFTIHKKIYRGVSDEGNFTFSLIPNMHTYTLFIVDEASMISGENTGDWQNKRNLLDDLVDYVHSGTNCKLMLIGDPAQLPPVGSVESPALDLKFIKARFHMNLFHIQLTEVMRQAQDSGVLMNATAIRNTISGKGEFNGFDDRQGDLFLSEGQDLEEHITNAYRDYGAEGTVFICRSNKRANLYNKYIRQRILWREEELAAGDLLMVVKNNYFWLDAESKAGFIANGDILEVSRVRNINSMHGFRFADIRVRLLDYPEEPEYEVKIILDLLGNDAPALTQDESRKLFYSVSEDYSHEGKGKQYQLVRKDPFYNALQVKFGYAVTCHKAQGGQWPFVAVDSGYLTKEMLNTEYYRWLYTALTRSSEKVCLAGFKNELFRRTE